MHMMTKLAVVGLVLLSTACTRPDRFTGGADAGAGAGTGTLGEDGASNPNSPQFFTQTIGDRVLFSTDSASLTEQGKTILNGQAKWLTDNADYLAIIEGHADEQGTREYNIGLGFRRANAVREYLVAQGVPATRMRVTSYGKERPAQICSAESCYAQNRRAVTVISIASLS